LGQSSPPRLPDPLPFESLGFLHDVFVGMVRLLTRGRKKVECIVKNPNGWSFADPHIYLLVRCGGPGLYAIVSPYDIWFALHALYAFLA
jgi:hypothetical protein